MKGFVKACLIAALIFAVAGIVLLVVAAAGGVSRATWKIFNQEKNGVHGPFRIETEDGFSVYFYGDEDEFFHVPEKDSDAGDDDSTALYFDGRYEVKRSDYTELHLDAGSGDYIIYESPDGMFYIEADREDVIVRDDENCLFIKNNEKSKIGLHFEMEPAIVIYVPAGYQFEEIVLDAGSGDIEVNTVLYAEDYTLDIGSGDVNIGSDIYADCVTMEVSSGDLSGYAAVCAEKDMFLSVGSGDVELDRIECKGLLETVCGSGELSVAGKVFGNINSKVASGDIIMNLNGNGQKYTYDIDVASGDIWIDQYSFSGLDTNVVLEGEEGAPKAELACGSGGLKIRIQ